MFRNGSPVVRSSAHLLMQIHVKTSLEINSGPKLCGQRPVNYTFWRKLLCFPPFFERNPIPHCHLATAAYLFYNCGWVPFVPDCHTAIAVYFFTTLDGCSLFLIVIWGALSHGARTVRARCAHGSMFLGWLPNLYPVEWPP